MSLIDRWTRERRHHTVTKQTSAVSDDQQRLVVESHKARNIQPRISPNRYSY